jgi:hypothetical protein
MDGQGPKRKIRCRDYMLPRPRPSTSGDAGAGLARKATEWSYGKVVNF